MGVNDGEERIFIKMPQGRACCYRTGSGPRLLIAFHGFSQTGAFFGRLAAALPQERTVYAIDLPFHGQTEWREDSYTPAQLVALVAAILEREGASQFEALGHSLGGRLWVSLLPYFTAEMKALYLLAPDGFHTRWMFLAEWLPGRLRRLLGRGVSKPGRALQLGRLFYRWKLIDGFLLHYLEHHLRDAGRRERLLKSWYALAHFPMNPKRARRLLRQSRVPVTALLGKQDKLVSADTTRRALAGLDNVSVEAVEGGHLFAMKTISKFM